ncbi:MAG: STAS-like domain-containing protein [Prevotellaceae bacterium]|jgi:hypothetical protein|nr:STAS-like domain-containing protein [Prevotellaceae bacterium]
MYTIDLKEILTNRPYPDAGAILYQQLVDKIDNEDKIILNLKNVDMLPSMFLNMSIGKIIVDFGVDKLKKITFAEITQIQAEKIKDYVARFSAGRQPTI